MFYYIYMPRKKYSRKSKKPRKFVKRKKHKKLQVSKSLRKTFNKMILKKLDQQIEDKYILDTSFSDQSSTYDASTNTLLFNVTPNILQGDEVNQRTGNKVRLKYLRTFFRFLPSRYHYNRSVDVSNDQSITNTRNWFAQKPRVMVYLVRINNQLAAQISDPDLRVALNAKFKSPGHCWQDYAQSSGQKALSGIKLMDKFQMAQVYRSMVTSWQPLHADVTQMGSGQDFDLTPDHGGTAVQVSVPQYTYKNFLCSKVAQKLEFNDEEATPPATTVQGPIKYQYWYFVQVGNGYNNSLYNPIDPPQDFATRNVWTFEDA